jgi:REP-associated tyrosine transposase
MIHEIDNYYHLYNRGCNKDIIFKQESDYEECIKRIVNSKLNKYVRIISYCLMPNHYHFLVQQISEIPSTKWIGFIMNGYVQYFNSKYSRSGTLFEGRVKSRLITDEQYLIQSTLYIHNNPVKSSLVENPEEWLYSSYLEWISGNDPCLVDKEFILERFDTYNDYKKLMDIYNQQ